MITIINMRENKTNQRKVILEELSKVKTHPTADEVYDMAKKRISNISLATVYRNLEWLVGKQQIRKLNIAGERKRYDADMKRHYHLRCKTCGKVNDLFVDELDKVEEILDKLKGVNGIKEYEIEFQGICKNCIANAN